MRRCAADRAPLRPGPGARSERRRGTDPGHPPAIRRKPRLDRRCHRSQAHPSIDRRSILDFDSQRRPQIPPRRQHLLDDHEGNGIVDVIHHVEVREAHGPGRELDVGGRTTQGQPRASPTDHAALRRRPPRTQPVSGAGRSVSASRCTHRVAELQRTTSGAVDVDAPLRPPRTEPGAPRDHVERLEVRRELHDVDHGSAHHPGHLGRARRRGCRRRRRSCRYRAAASSRSRPPGEQSPSRTRRSPANVRPALGCPTISNMSVTINELTQPQRSGCLSLDLAHLCPADEPRKVPGTMSTTFAPQLAPVAVGARPCTGSSMATSGVQQPVVRHEPQFHERDDYQAPRPTPREATDVTQIRREHPLRGRRDPIPAAFLLFPALPTRPRGTTRNVRNRHQPRHRHRVRRTGRAGRRARPQAALRRRPRHPDPPLLLGHPARHRPGQGHLQQVLTRCQTASTERSSEPSPGVCGAAS